MAQDKGPEGAPRIRIHHAEMAAPTPRPERQGADYNDLPEVLVTMNQVVAYNVRYFRRARGLTQERLGERLEQITGKVWSKATISALERGWDGVRVRQVDADELAALSQALDYPIPALLLPPVEDGVSARYRIAGVGTGQGTFHEPQQQGTAADLMEFLFVSNDDGAYVEDSAYAHRVQSNFSYYFGGDPGSTIWDRTDMADEYYGSDDHVRDLALKSHVLRSLLSGVDRHLGALQSAESRAEARLQTTLSRLDETVERLQKQDQTSWTESAMRAADDQRERVEAALARITEGTFGTCVICEKGIPPEQLGKEPEEPLCPYCQAGEGVVKTFSNPLSQQHRQRLEELREDSRFGWERELWLVTSLHRSGVDVDTIARAIGETEKGVWEMLQMASGYSLKQSMPSDEVDHESDGER